VVECRTEHILALKGGSREEIAYLSFYRLKE
jgi:hypothetical protein